MNYTIAIHICRYFLRNDISPPDVETLIPVSYTHLQSREEAKLSKIRDIPISEIDEFPDHPFKVLDVYKRQCLRRK